MLSFNDFNKKIHNKEYEIVKSRSGLPMFILDPPDIPIKRDDEPKKKKEKTIPQMVSDFISVHKN